MREDRDMINVIEDAIENAIFRIWMFWRWVLRKGPYSEGVTPDYSALHEDHWPKINAARCRACYAVQRLRKIDPQNKLLEREDSKTFDQFYLRGRDWKFVMFCEVIEKLDQFTSELTAEASRLEV